MDALRQNLNLNFNTPVCRDIDWLDVRPHIAIPGPPASELIHESGCSLNYLHHHPIFTSPLVLGTLSTLSPSRQSGDAADVCPIGIVSSPGIYIPPSDKRFPTSRQLHNPVLSRSMGWLREIYPPIQPLRPIPADHVHTQDPGIIAQLTEHMQERTEDTLQIFEDAFIDGGIHTSTFVHRLSPFFYYPQAFFNTLGQHNLNFVMQHLQHLEAMSPRAEAWDENGESEEISCGTDETCECLPPTPPWLEDPKPWLMPALTTNHTPVVPDQRTTRETRGRESLKIRIDLQRLKTSDVPLDVDPLPNVEPRLKILIAQQRLQLLRLAQDIKKPRA